jgi:hypothetical protein
MVYHRECRTGLGRRNEVFDLPDIPLSTSGRTAMAVAREIASEAGDTLVERFHQVKSVTSKGRGNIVTDVDTQVEEKMLEAV